MENDKAKLTIGSGKLSLSKRRREKRNRNACKDGGNKINSRGRKRQRAPIPSFSPLDKNCDIVGPIERSQGIPSEETKPKINRTMNAENGANNPHRDRIGESRNILQSIKTQSIHKGDSKNMNQMINNQLRGNNTEKFQVKNSLKNLSSSADRPEQNTKSSMNCFKSFSTDHISVQNSKNNTSVEGSDDLLSASTPATIWSIEVGQSKLKVDQKQGRVGKPTIPNSYEKNKIVVTSLMRCENSEISQQSRENEKEMLLRVDPNCNEQSKTLKRRSRSSQKSTSKSSTPAVNFIQSPSLKDFIVPHYKYLNDKEIDMKKRHDELLDVSRNEVLQHQQPPRKRTQTKQRISSPITQSKLCTLCSTCTCARGSALQSLEDTAISEHQNPLDRLARSEAEVERALIGRLSRLEKSASWFDHLCNKVSRELKRHRHKIKARIQRNNNTTRPKFLRDVNEDDEMQFSAPAISNKYVDKAKRQIFSFRKKCQPTLTQMLGDSDNEKTDIQSGAENVGIIIEEEPTKESLDYLPREDQDQNDLETNQATNDGNFENYDEAWNRGKTRSLWKASTMTEEQFKESNVKVDFDQVLEIDQDPNESVDQSSAIANEENVYYDGGLSDLLDVFDSIDSDDPSSAIDDILGIYGKIGSCHVNESQVIAIDITDPTTISQLSPVAKLAFGSMARKIENDNKKVKLLDAECPNWKENLRFALRQNPRDLKEALINVQNKQKYITKALEALKKQSAVLEVFEMALKESSDRHDDCTINMLQEDFDFSCGNEP